jgi:4-amino-4-deoxy-L-arabinose transferase-like glycosyltransferase
MERSRWSSAAVFAAAVVVNLIFQLTLPPALRVEEHSDIAKPDYARFYEPIAQHLLAGRGFQLADGVPATMYPPGYPLFVAGALWLSNQLGVRPEAVFEAVAPLAMGFSSLLLYVLARRLWPSHAALVAPLLWLTYPFALWLTKQPNPEMPFVVVLSGAWYVFWAAAVRRSRSWAHYFLCGLLVGLAMLIRPIAIGLGLLFGALLWFGRRDLEVRARALLAAAILAGNAIAVFPWELWVYRRTNRLLMLSTAGTAGIGDGLTYAIDRRDFRQAMVVPEDVATVMRNVMAQTSRLNSLGGVGSLMWEELRARPVAVAKLIALKAARSWYATNSGRHEGASLLIQAGYLILLLWAGSAAWKRGGIIRQFAVGTGVLVIYFWGMTILALSILRYMVPAIGLAFLVVPSLVPVRQKARGEG